jgi:hypothetical protein
MSQTLFAVAVVAAVLVAVVVAALGGVLLTDVRAQAAADAAALAAAHATARTMVGPAGAARAAARAHGATVVVCRCDGPVVEVHVRATVPVAAARLAGVGWREAVARARLVDRATQPG